MHIHRRSTWFKRIRDVGFGNAPCTEGPGTEKQRSGNQCGTLHLLSRGFFDMCASRHAEQRRSVRTPLSVPAKILSGPNQISALTLDVSATGAALCTSTLLAATAECVIAMDILLGEKRVRINAWGIVVYCQVQEGAFRTGVHIVDMDSHSLSSIREVQRRLLPT